MTSERQSGLAGEIVESQKTKASLLTWKFVVVAALGVAGLMKSKDSSPIPFVLALVPFACVYVDLICSTVTTRQVVIGTFFATETDDEYERFVRRCRSVFAAEDFASFGATLGLSLCVLGYGIVRGLRDPSEIEYWVVGVAGLVGVAITLRTRMALRRGMAMLQDLVPFGSLPRCVPSLKSVVQRQYTNENLDQLEQVLISKSVFAFKSLHTGVFAAAAGKAHADPSGYQNAWIRDNVYVAFAHHVVGDNATALRVLAGLTSFLKKELPRVANWRVAHREKDDPMSRIHVRFDGNALERLPEVWSHAQNDALGYFLWLYGTLARARVVPHDQQRDDAVLISGLIIFLNEIEYWEDKDSGHWEEVRKVSASSIGTVVAALSLLLEIARERRLPLAGSLDEVELRELVARGRAALDRHLPDESRSGVATDRTEDAAQLFLIYPLRVLSDVQRDQVLFRVTARLQGSIGFKRYLGDSYWCANYDRHIPASHASGNFANNIEARDALLVPGQEAQWCLFDSILSVIHGEAARRHCDAGDSSKAAVALRFQTLHFNRALAQLIEVEDGSGSLAMPELYYLTRGRLAPNPNAPLLWAQSNLWLALHHMKLNRTLSSELYAKEASFFGALGLRAWPDSRRAGFDPRPSA